MDILITVLVIINTLLTVFCLYTLRTPNPEEYEEEGQETGSRYDLYNTAAFHQRMAKMRKEEIYDGVPLFDVPIPKIKSYSEPGVEIITPSMEMEIERRIR